MLGGSHVITAALVLNTLETRNSVQEEYDSRTQSRDNTRAILLAIKMMTLQFKLKLNKGLRNVD